MKAFFMSVLLLTAVVGFACLNEHHVTKHGKESVDGFSLHNMRFYKQHNNTEMEQYIQNLQQENPVTEKDMLVNQNSIAVSYIKLGRLEDAEKILNGLFKKHPADYSVIINLGTLYELQGKNQKALEFIKKAVAVNPESHGGSEWFHIRVLEYKLKNSSFSNIAADDILKIGTLKKSAAAVAHEIQYQLEERIPFTKAPDLLMAKILQEYAGFLADSISLKGSYVIYDMAMDYDRNDVLKLKEKRDALKPYFKKYGESIPVTGIYYIDRMIPVDDNDKINAAVNLLDKGLSYFKEQDEKRKREAQQKKYLIWGGSGILVLAGIFIFLKRRKRNETA
jgi:tetratricopeptide (TPR) repeat protein